MLKLIGFFFSAIAITSVVLAEPQTQGQNREFHSIKSLSVKDVEILQRGGGWGFAKAAELNGYPGPAHVLELKTDLQLTEKQTAAIQALFNDMQIKAQALGTQFLELERKLNAAFANQQINSQRLTSLIHKIEKIRAKLRFVHLSAHLQTPEILTEEQISQYNKLRGYKNSNCQPPPNGHDPEMWRKHHGCD